MMRWSLGIGMIHQHFKLVDVFTAQDNIVMGTEKRSPPAKKKRWQEKSLPSVKNMVWKLTH